MSLTTGTGLRSSLEACVHATSHAYSFGLGFLESKNLELVDLLVATMHCMY